MSRIRLLLAWLVLAAIPLQGLAAASMLFCGMGAAHHQAQVQAQVESQATARHDHAKHGHVEAVPAKAEQAADSQAQLPDASHKCGVCGSCCSSAAITGTPRPLALAPPPQSGSAEPFVLIHPRPSPVPDKPPRI